MNWDDLRFFLAVAEAGALAPAARELRVNHSTVFRRINALEEKLETRLFDRLREGYRLTEEGAAVLEEARRIQLAVHEIDRRIAGRDIALTGPIRLTTPLNLATRFLPGMLVDFTDRYPQIRVEIAVSDTDYDLSRREADLALRATPNPPEHLIGRKVAELPWYAMASEPYLARRPRPDGPRELADHCMIGADPGFSRLPVFAWQEKHYAEESIRFRSNNLSTMAAMARAGLGIALLPLDQDDRGLIRLFPVCEEATSALWLLTHPDLRRTARVRVLMKYLGDALRSDPRLQPTAV